MENAFRRHLYTSFQHTERVTAASCSSCVSVVKEINSRLARAKHCEGTIYFTLYCCVAAVLSYCRLLGAGIFMRRLPESDLFVYEDKM